MGAFLGLICLLIFIFVWLYPVLKRHKELGGYVDRKTEFTALLLGMIPATVVLLLCQFALGWIFKLVGISDKEILMCFLKSFVMYGIIEEVTKYGFSRLVIRKFERLKKIDIMLIFGFVGMGYEIAETMMNGNLIAGIGRGIFVAHIMYQFVMAHFFYESIRAKNAGDDAGAKKNMFFSLAIPALIHGINDLFCELAPIFMEKIAGIDAADLTVPQAMPLFSCFGIIIMTNVFCLVWGLKLAKKDPDTEVALK